MHGRNLTNNMEGGRGGGKIYSVSVFCKQDPSSGPKNFIEYLSQGREIIGLPGAPTSWNDPGIKSRYMGFLGPTLKVMLSIYSWEGTLSFSTLCTLHN